MSDNFVSGPKWNSTEFADVLVVLMQNKVEEFKHAMNTLMDEYYKVTDDAEKKRMDNQVKIQLEECKHYNEDQLKEFKEEVG